VVVRANRETNVAKRLGARQGSLWPRTKAKRRTTKRRGGSNLNRPLLPQPFHLCGSVPKTWQRRKDFSYFKFFKDSQYGRERRRARKKGKEEGPSSQQHHVYF